MKITLVAGLAVATLVSARHQHGVHQHQHLKRTATQTAVVAGPTVVVYVLDGKVLPQAQVDKGLANGSLVFADEKPGSSIAPGAFFVASSSTATVAAAATSAAAPAPAAAAPAAPAAAAPAAAAPAANSLTVQAKGLDADFPDGQLSCSTFPSDYGAVPYDYHGMKGWIGIQYVSIVGSFVNRIVGGVQGNDCTEGAMCSYACPPGYQKSQWPLTQGANGESVGGISCSGGKLRLTNPGLSKKLCIPGAGGVQIQNTLGQSVAVCRTDYPGSESETVPTVVSPGQVQPITNPVGETYYKHQGAITSAQYYINPAGAPVSSACTWNSAGSNLGNWAPVNLGVGMRDGKTWISIFQNAPTNTDGVLNYQIEIVGSNGAQLGGTCKYAYGTWTGSAAAGKGCTVGVTGGMVTFKISA